MDIEEAIRAFALLDPNIATAFGERFYVDRVPDEVGNPFAKLSLIAPDVTYHHKGRSGNVQLFQLDIYDSSKSSCNTSSDLIIARFDGYRGLMGEITVGRIWARIVRGDFAETTRLFRRIIEMEVATNG